MQELLIGLGRGASARLGTARLHKQNKPSISHIKAAIVGYAIMGATIKQIVRVIGVSVLDVEAIIIENKLSVKP